MKLLKPAVANKTTATTTAYRCRAHHRIQTTVPNSSPRDALHPSHGRRGRCHRTYPCRCRRPAVVPSPPGPGLARPKVLAPASAGGGGHSPIGPTLTSTASSRGKIRPTLGQAFPADRSARQVPTHSDLFRRRWPGSATAPDLRWVHPAAPWHWEGEKELGGVKATPSNLAGAAPATVGAASTTKIGGPAWRVRRRRRA
jgi:hypothetical protein